MTVKIRQTPKSLIGHWSLVIIWLLVIGHWSLAQVPQLQDVPKDHWAASAVYDLVRLGITKGYPDGTFRGQKPISRYEAAIFLSKLAKAIGVEDIKPELEDLRSKLLELKKETKMAPALEGWYVGDWKVGNLLLAKNIDRGTIGSYRLV
ncbi:MAG: S-layer homology domain-containing protein, partial [Candidatus Margulisiibacteriota bacterium]